MLINFTNREGGEEVIGEKIKLKTTITDYKIERKTVEYSVYTWWLRFLRFVFRREWAKLKDDILDTVSLYATAEIHNEINNYLFCHSTF